MSESKMVNPPASTDSNPPSATEMEALRKRLDALEAENRALRAATPGVKAPVAYEGSVKTKLIHAVRLSNGETFGPGDEVMMSESDAKEFCDKTFTNVYPFSGEVDRTADLGSMRRALRA